MRTASVSDSGIAAPRWPRNTELAACGLPAGICLSTDDRRASYSGEFRVRVQAECVGNSRTHL